MLEKGGIRRATSDLQRVGGKGILSRGGAPCSLLPRNWAGSLAGGQRLLPSESRQSWAVWTVESNARIDSEIGTGNLESPLVLGRGLCHTWQL